MSYYVEKPGRFGVVKWDGQTVVVGPKWGSAANPYLQFWMMTDAEVAERFNPAP